MPLQLSLSCISDLNGTFYCTQQTTCKIYTRHSPSGKTYTIFQSRNVPLANPSQFLPWVIARTDIPSPIHYYYSFHPPSPKTPPSTGWKAVAAFEETLYLSNESPNFGKLKKSPIDIFYPSPSPPSESREHKENETKEEKEYRSTAKGAMGGILPKDKTMMPGNWSQYAQRIILKRWERLTGVRVSNDVVMIVWIYAGSSLLCVYVV